MIQGFKDWRTTVPALVSAFFGFVLFKPQYFPQVLVDVGAYIFAGGLVAFGIQAASRVKNGGKQAP